jgi:hypothetical protein
MISPRASATKEGKASKKEEKGLDSASSHVMRHKPTSTLMSVVFQSHQKGF